MKYAICSSIAALSIISLGCSTGVATTAGLGSHQIQETEPTETLVSIWYFGTCSEMDDKPIEQNGFQKCTVVSQFYDPSEDVCDEDLACEPEKRERLSMNVQSEED